ncbi:MAG: hypothetical protein M3A44_04910 [Gammaproteobacteria bacterium]
MFKKMFFPAALIFAALTAAPLAQASDAFDGLDAARAGDYGQAATLIAPLAMQGNPQAQFNLALMYHSGAGVAQNEAEAVVWYHKAAENGKRPAAPSIQLSLMPVQTAMAADHQCGC